MKQKIRASQATIIGRKNIVFFLLILGVSPCFATPSFKANANCIHTLNLNTRQTIQQSEAELNVFKLIGKIENYETELSKYSDNRRASDALEDLISSTSQELARTLEKAIANNQISGATKEKLASEFLKSNLSLIPVLKLNHQQSETFITFALNSPEAKTIQRFLGSLDLSTDRKTEIAKMLLEKKHFVWRYLRETNISVDDLVNTWIPLGLGREGVDIFNDNLFINKLTPPDLSKLARTLGTKTTASWAIRILAPNKLLSKDDLDYLAVEDLKRSPGLLADSEFHKLFTPELYSSIKKHSLLNSDSNLLSRYLSINMGYASPVAEIKTKLNSGIVAYWPEMQPFLLSLFGKVSNQKVIITLLSAYLKQLRSEVDATKNFNSKEEIDTTIARANQKLQIGLTQDSLFSLVTGLPKKSIEQIKSKNLLRDVFLVALDIQDKFDKPLADVFGLKLSDQGDLTGEQLLKLAVVIRDRIDLGDSIESIRTTTLGFGPNEINSQTIDSLIEQNQNYLFKTIAQTLQMKTSPSTKDIGELEIRWQGLDPLLTLLSRYKSNADWNQLLPSLGKTLEQSLKHTFQRFKFFGDPTNAEDQVLARKQLSMLKDPEEIRAWTRNRTVVKTFEGQPIVPNIADLTNEVAAIVKSNIVGEIEMEANVLSYEDVGTINNLLEERQGTRKLIDDFINSNKKSQNPERSSFEKLIVALHSNTPNDLKSLGKLLSLARIALDRAKQSFSEEELTNILNNFEDIDARIKSWTRMGNNRTVEGLIITTLNSDPKFLITIGDLVDAFSCQNYRTGSHIQSLMGYVMDANVQGLASFFIGPESFENHSDYQTIVEASKNNSLKSYFDGNKRSLTLKVGSTEKSITITLPKALYRSMVKLGATPNGTAGLKMERAYTPSLKADYLSSGLNTALSSNANEIFETLVEELHATSEGPVTVYGSRSPGGMYTDAAGGVRVGDYTIENE